MARVERLIHFTRLINVRLPNNLPRGLSQSLAVRHAKLDHIQLSFSFSRPRRVGYENENQNEDRMCPSPKPPDFKHQRRNLRANSTD